MDDAVRGAGDGGGEAPHTQAPPPSPSDLAAENARLKRENERLRMERDILKKAALIFGSASR
jgi:transposase